MAASDVARGPAVQRRQHRALVAVLVATGCLAATLAVVALWLDRQLLDTDEWTATSTELLEQPAVRDELATYLVGRLYAEADVPAQLQAALPAPAARLAAPAAAALRDGADRATRKLLSTPQVQALWEDANRAAHRELLRVLDGGGPVVSTTGGDVTLDLRALLHEVGSDLGLQPGLGADLPADAARITVVRSDRLKAAQRAAHGLRALPAVLILLALGCFGAAVALSAGRRRAVLRACGAALVVAGMLSLACASAGRAVVGDAVVTTASVQPAFDAVWQIATRLLRDAAGAAIVLGLLVVLGATLAGPSRPASAARRHLAPLLRSPEAAYGTVAVVVAGIAWWGPIAATRHLASGLVLVALLVAGVAVLRRQVAAEHPA